MLLEKNKIIEDLTNDIRTIYKIPVPITDNDIPYIMLQLGGQLNIVDNFNDLDVKKTIDNKFTITLFSISNSKQTTRHRWLLMTYIVNCFYLWTIKLILNFSQNNQLTKHQHKVWNN